jgi:polyisoprenoid-binding protein YceI
MLRRFLLAAALIASATPAFAETKTYKFDHPHTQILFFVNHLGFSNSNGKFLDFDGTITFDTDKPSEGKVDVVIKTDSLNMDDAKWDEHLKSKDFFNVKEYPTMTFKSSGVVAAEGQATKLTGDLTLLGVTKPVTMDVTLNKCDVHPMTKQPTCGFDATTTIKRSEWGMTGGIPMVSDDVKIMITVEAVAQPAENQ